MIFLSNNVEEKILHGTTTVGIKASDGVVLCADMRASAGYFIANNNTMKIQKLDDHAGLTLAGGVADAQNITDTLRYHAGLHRITTLDELDAVVIGHAHLDHTGFLPALCKYGYRGPIYCTEPTLPMMNLIQLDAIKVMSAQGRVPIYSDRDVKQIMKQTITLPYGLICTNHYSFFYHAN